MKILNKEEIKQIISKPYLSTDELSELCCCKISKGYQIKKEIDLKVESEG